MNDQQLIAAIRSGNLEKPVKQLYKEYPKIERLIVKSGGSKEMAGEIFNDSLLLLIEKIQHPQFKLTSKISTFLYGINHFLAKNEVRKEQSSVTVTWENVDSTSIENDYDHEREAQLTHMESLLQKVSEKCRSIFKLFYYEHKSMKEVAEELAYTSTNSAKTQKYKCMEQLHKLAHEANLSSKSH